MPERQLSIYAMLARLELLAEKECTCTEEQQKGIDPSVCDSCAVARDFNEIAKEIRLVYEAFFEN